MFNGQRILGTSIVQRKLQFTSFLRLFTNAIQEDIREAKRKPKTKITNEKQNNKKKIKIRFRPLHPA